MQYLPDNNQVSGAGKYHGKIASGYEARREESPKWILEQRIIQDMLGDLPPGTRVLDCPVGTGRFLPFYQDKEFQVLGMDISEDMIGQAAMKVRIPEFVQFAVGDVRRTGLADKEADVAVNCRITRWLSPDDCQQMLREMQRIARQRIIWTARVANHPHARSLELFEAALTGGWAIHRNEAGADLDYRIIEARPAA